MAPKVNPVPVVEAAVEGFAEKLNPLALALAPKLPAWAAGAGAGAAGGADAGAGADGFD